LVFVYEESLSQLVRNMRSIGLHLEQWIDAGLLTVHASRPTLYGLEQHLMQIHEMVLEHEPSLVVVDPMSNLTLDVDDGGLKPTLMRLIDFLKDQGITVMFTNLTADTPLALALTQTGVSSLMDTWMLLANMAENRERIRTIQILKSRGMEHSNQIREFMMSGRGSSWSTSSCHLQDLRLATYGAMNKRAWRLPHEKRRLLRVKPVKQLRWDTKFKGLGHDQALRGHDRQARISIAVVCGRSHREVARSGAEPERDLRVPPCWSIRNRDCRSS